MISKSRLLNLNPKNYEINYSNITDIHTVNF